ncbi:MAG TPA: potassium transporter [Sedimenticola thiotaurini]|uniref:Trk system potassium uptake protein n=1 Tax=Sedimenticola thiotaurini TaxID=1543721 RepID=A0A831RPX1_9GAMM|nr:potassium transporter [Sedimenticola thiotaurini]
MRGATILRIVGFFFIGFSLTMLIPLAISLWYDDGEARHFLTSLVVILLPGLVFAWFGRGARHDLATRDGFLVVAIFWGGISTVASLPFILGAHLGFVDALFEAVSGFTTTGATVITGLEQLPKSVLFYRQQLQWFGGMGLIVLGVAVLPLVGIGGMQLYRAEAPGPMKEEKLTPRLAHTAQVLWVVYVGITVANAVAYWLAGMTPFDAVAHSLSTVSTGGFSTHDESLGWFRSPLIEAIATLFMLAGAINFSVHFLAWRRRSLRVYLQDVEVRTFLLFVAGIILLASLILRTSGEYHTLPPSLRNATFEVVSVVTSTGFGTVDFSRWPDFLPVLLIFISFVGGCGGSTAGGMKVIRVHVLAQMGLREVRRLIHPRALLPVRLGGRVLRERTLESVWGFFAAYVLSFVVLMLLMMHAGLDQVSAFSAIATSMNNLGPGLGEVATSFSGVSDAGKLIAAFAMLLGRLEIFTILVLLTPAFWRR